MVECPDVTSFEKVLSTSLVLSLQIILISFQTFYHDYTNMGFPGVSDGKESACSAGDLGLISGSRRSPGEGNGNPLQHSCLENPMDRGAWWAAVYGVTHTYKHIQYAYFQAFKQTKTPYYSYYLIALFPFSFKNNVDIFTTQDLFEKVFLTQRFLKETYISCWFSQ